MAIAKYFSKLFSCWLKHLLIAGLIAGMVLAALPVPRVPAQQANLYEVRSFNCNTVGDVPTDECEALVALYDNTDGDHWFENENWLISTDVDDWYGVTVTGGHVTHIDLTNNLMNGTIPAELEDLSMIKNFSFAFNELSGGIPSWLGNLTTLENLGLGENPLGGEIPSSLGNLVNLTALMLFHTGVTGSIPSELGNLDNVIHMHLNNNLLDGNIPPELGDMDSIEHLWMGDNQLEGSIPEELGDLTQIHTLFLEENQLTGDIPDSLTNLTNLDLEEGGLNLGYNHLNTTGLSQTLLDFLAVNDPDWKSTQVAEETITGGTGGSLTSNDGNTEITIPPDAVEGEVTFTFEPQPPFDFLNVYSNNRFELTAQDSLEDPVTEFAEPLTVKLYYDEEDLKGGWEEDLNLYYWDKGANMWLDVVTTCDGGVYTRNLAENWLSVNICHLSEFNLFGKTLRSLYLPLITR